MKCSEVLGLPDGMQMFAAARGAAADHFGNGSDHFHKLMLGEDGGGDDADEEDCKMDDLDMLLRQNEHNNNLAELKPLPPFTGYTGHLSINGISGHHYHSIAAPASPRPAPEANNNDGDAANQNAVFYTDHQVVSSSTMDCSMEIKTEQVDYNNLITPDIEDIAAIIGNAIADTTVPGGQGETSRDSWMDLDAWIDTACEQNSGKAIISSESLQEFVANSQFTVVPPPPPTIPFLCMKREPGGYSHMPLLQSRLQNGPPKAEITYSLVSECPSPSSSTPYSPPGHVVSTSDLIRYNPVHSSTRPSPELQVSFPHTTTPTKKSRSRSKSKQQAATSTVVYSDTCLGKEKPVHRCTICNRGFLNKSNIKVHLRTHTGEKPFRCDVCGKAFRQKAHLIKHAQIHKRIGRD